MLAHYFFIENQISLFPPGRYIASGKSKDKDELIGRSTGSNNFGGLEEFGEFDRRDVFECLGFDDNHLKGSNIAFNSLQT
jgi:hypothetical protein